MLDGNLFTRDYLNEGVRDTAVWRRLTADELAAFADRLRRALAGFSPASAENEDVTKQELIYPVLDALGWTSRLGEQQTERKGRAEVPDVILFADEVHKAEARREREPARRWRHGLSFLEAKRWGLPLDRGTNEVPSSKMLGYLTRVEVMSERRIQWGILTNGRQWRLYFQGARSRSEEYLEIDLAAALRLPGFVVPLPTDAGLDPDHLLRLFILFFRPQAFLPQPDDARTLHQLALDRGRSWEARVTEKLSGVVFDQVFPALLAALAAADRNRPQPADDAWLDALREAALTLLYRLLFLLYAEDRNLLPFDDRRYRSYSLHRMREEAARRIDDGEPLSTTRHGLYTRVLDLFDLIDHGDDALRLPAYNGGLFDPERAPLLQQARLSDAVFVPLLDALSREATATGRRWINYRDLSVRQLGSIYEQLLEHRPVEREDGSIGIAESAVARKRSGSFYTPDHLVQLIVELTVGPLVRERLDIFKQRADALASERRGRRERVAELAVCDPAAALLDLRIVDPAMGSGHFLVNLVDYLADQTLAVTEDAAEAVRWAEYRSPLLTRIQAIRGRIEAEARQHGWLLRPEHLDDRQIVRRMILKRCVYGVDKNPMAVELTKLSLWLHTFTVGAPLSFLDHHLRCGDSLFGEWIRPVVDELTGRYGLFLNNAIQAAKGSARGMAEIEALSDAAIAEVEVSASVFTGIETATRPLARFLDVWQALRWHKPGKDELMALGPLLDGSFGPPVGVVAGTTAPIPPNGHEHEDLFAADDDAQVSLLAANGERNLANYVRAMRLLARTRALAARERFLHWQVAYPGVWNDWESAELRGGFDAVIGNPPYVRQEEIKELKPRLKESFGAYHGMADLYVYFYEQGLKLLRPGGRLSYVVTNKWLKAGYAEALRGLFAERGELERVIDFGHAKQLFKGIDVFPSVIVIRKPAAAAEPAEDATSADAEPADAAPADVQVCVIPRENLREEELGKQIAAASYRLPRARFGRESWVLEPPEVQALLDKIRRNGVPLVEYAGVKPLYGIKTGFNEAFLIDTPTRDRLVAEDPGCAEIIKPYLRGQDIERWHAPWRGLWMIFTRRGIDITRYPSVLRHLERYRSRLEPKPEDWKPRTPDEEWPGRKPGRYAWYEIQDSIDYWKMLSSPKIVYKDIAWQASFAFDDKGRYINNTVYFLPTSSSWFVVNLNAPVAWWFAWRMAQHGKDEALRLFNDFMEDFPMASADDEISLRASEISSHLVKARDELRVDQDTLIQWYFHELGIDDVTGKLSTPALLSREEFVAEIRKACGKGGLSAATLKLVQEEWERTVRPAQALLAEAERLEVALSDLVNAAYGLTPEEVDLMWRTAPPRMPLAHLYRHRTG